MSARSKFLERRVRQLTEEAIDPDRQFLMTDEERHNLILRIEGMLMWVDIYEGRDHEDPDHGQSDVVK